MTRPQTAFITLSLQMGSRVWSMVERDAIDVCPKAGGTLNSQDSYFVRESQACSRDVRTPDIISHRPVYLHKRQKKAMHNDA